MKSSFLFLSKKGCLSSLMQDILYDKSLFNRYFSLEKYLDSQHISFNKTHLTEFISHVESMVYESSEYLVYLIYYLMEIEDDWGAAGKQQVQFSFAQSVLGLDEMDYSAMQKFQAVVLAKVTEYGFQLSSKTVLKKNLLNFKITLFDQKYGFDEFNELNRLLKFIGSKYGVFHSLQSENHLFLYGQFVESSQFELLIYDVGYEKIRSPNLVTALVAFMIKDKVVVRCSALDHIYQMKWLTYFKQEPLLLTDSKAFKIGHAFKKHVMALFGCNTEVGFKKKKTLFLSFMRENILFHETGHFLVSYKELSLKKSSIALATSLVPDSILETFLEVFSDFFPAQDGFSSTFQNLIAIHDKDPLKAQIMFYIYFSDVWFFDTPDEYMYLYSELMSLILIKYIRDDRSIDFEQLKKDFILRKDYTSLKKKTFFEQLVTFFDNITESVETIIVNTTFKLAKNVDFKTFCYVLDNLYKEMNASYKKTDYKYQHFLWLSLVKGVLDYSDSSNQLKSALMHHSSQVLKSIMIMTCGKEKAKVYNYNARKFIEDSLTEKGLA